MTDILDSRYSWIRLLITLGVATIGSAGMWSIVIVLPAVGRDFGVERGDASLAYSATMGGFALGSLLIGRAVDRVGVTRVLWGAGAVVAAAYGLAALTGTFAVYAGLQFLIGLGAASCFAPLVADISHWFQKRRGIAVAIAASGNYLAGVVWPVALAPLMAAEGWRASYAAMAVLSLILIGPLGMLLRRRLPVDAAATGAGTAQANIRSAGLSPRALQAMLCAAGVACCVAMSMPQVHIVGLCVDLGYGPAVGAEMLSLMLAGGVVSRLASGMVADRIGGPATLLIGSVLQCIALFLYLPFDGLASLYVVSLVFGLAQGGIVPAYAIIVREYLPAKEAGARVGLVIMSTIIGMALGGWMSGWIYDMAGSYDLAFLNGIAWNFVNIALIGVLLARSRSARGVQAAA